MSSPYYRDADVTLHVGDSIHLLRAGATLGYDFDLGYEATRLVPDCSVDAVVTDPPYGLEFMGQGWDTFGHDSKVAAGMGATGYTDGAERLQRPSFLGGLNPKCQRCGLWQRGGNPCVCETPDFPNERRARTAAFGAWCEEWMRECLRVLKPGGHLLAFGGSRTWHRLQCAAEDAGFEIRDSIAWLYASGFPKSLDVSKAIDKSVGAERTPGEPERDRVAHLRNERYATGGAGFSRERGTTLAATAGPPASEAARQWDGWGTALKPAFEPIVVARKPLAGTVAGNVLAHGTGALNIDGCRLGEEARTNAAAGNKPGGAALQMSAVDMPRDVAAREVTGRWTTRRPRSSTPRPVSAQAACSPSTTRGHRRPRASWARSMRCPARGATGTAVARPGSSPSSTSRPRPQPANGHASTTALPTRR